MTLDEETARWVRVEAAKRDTSVSKLLGEVLESYRERVEGYERARAAFMDRKPRRLRAERGPLPERASIHDRRDPRSS